MKKNPLGSTGLTVSEVAFGTSPLGELFGPLDEVDAIRTVHEVIDLGINIIDSSPYYGNAEERLGKALTGGRRDKIVLATKAGRYGFDDFDFTPQRIRRSFAESCRKLATDYIDIYQLHDIEFQPLDPIIHDSIPELLEMKEEGLVGAIGVTGYPAATITRMIEECDLDVTLTYSHATLIDGSLEGTVLPAAAAKGTGVINAAAVYLGLLTPGGSSIDIDHPATPGAREAAAAMVALCRERGVNIAHLANQYSIQRSGGATTVIGTRKIEHVREAVEAASDPIDEELLATVLALRPPIAQRTWSSGLPENN